MNISFRIDDEKFIYSLNKIETVINASHYELYDNLGRLVQGQHRRRIAEEKTTPEGDAWEDNQSGTSILYRSTDLEQSIDYAIGADFIEVGSPLIYAGVHQFGAVITPKHKKALRFPINGQYVFSTKVTIPARPWLGLSDDNREEIIESVHDWVEGGLKK